MYRLRTLTRIHIPKEVIRLRDKEENKLVTIKKENPLLEAKKIIQKAMKENKRSSKDVKRDLELDKYND